MRYQSTVIRFKDYLKAATPPVPANSNEEVTCNWRILSQQLLEQWDRISKAELEATGHNRRRIASLIQRKYGVPVTMAENYLRNFERTLPMLEESA
jgi:hypothetical protein